MLSPALLSNLTQFSGKPRPIISWVLLALLLVRMSDASHLTRLSWCGLRMQVLLPHPCMSEIHRWSCRLIACPERIGGNRCSWTILWCIPKTNPSFLEYFSYLVSGCLDLGNIGNLYTFSRWSIIHIYVHLYVSCFCGVSCRNLINWNKLNLWKKLLSW